MNSLLLSFPPGSLAQDSQKLDAQIVGEGLVAISKPAGMPAEKIIREINRRLDENIPSFKNLGLDKALSVYSGEEEFSGLILIAGTKNYARWRDALGSALMTFHFDFLTARAAAIENDFFCDLPVAKHFTEPRAVISSTTGKKSRSDFHRLASTATIEKWRATSTFPRFHQIRIHAAECGISILADSLYGDNPAVTIADLRPKKRLNKGDDKAFYPHLCLHLARIDITIGGNCVSINAAAPKGLATLEKKLGL
ncbi:MAG: hypothetical protein K6B46_02355 [Opitutales bacterium]|nr:hypothetical protein [Opitutales bacterium]